MRLGRAVTARGSSRSPEETPIPFLWARWRDSPRDGAQESAIKDYLVIYEQAEDGAWGAHSPDVEDVFALGTTREEAEARIAEALTAHLAYLRETGQPIPDPHTDAGRVAA